MLYKSQFWFLTIIAGLAVILSGANMVLFQNNRSAQMQASARQQYIQQSVQLQAFYNDMVRAIADLAVKNQDAELVNLLKSQGISISTPAASGPHSPTTKGAK